MLSTRRLSDRITNLELGIKEVTLKVVNVYAPQVGKRTERGILEKVR